MKEPGVLGSFFFITFILTTLTPEITSSSSMYTVSMLCSNIPPGMETMTRGVDITKLDIIPLDTGIPNGLVRSLFEFTCFQGKTWTNPYNSSIVYEIPDQIETIDSVPGGVKNAVTNMYTKYEEVKRSDAAYFAVDYKGGMFSASASVVMAHDTFTNSTRSSVDVQAFFSGMHIDLAPYWELQFRKSIQTYIDKYLPDNYTDNAFKYQEFIRLFGTHYFGSGRFGGLFKIRADYENNLRRNMSSQEIKVNAEANFFNILKINGGYDGDVHKVSEEFSSKSSISSRFFGGKLNLLKDGDWNNWCDTISSDPWLFGGTLESIVDLFPEGSKKISMELAISIHLRKTNLAEMERTLYSFIGKGLASEDRARILLAEFSNIPIQDMPEATVVAELETRVNDFIIPPDWFLENTELCFNWYPTGDPGQCQAESRELCAKVNSMTPYYRDATDNRPGGCVLRWGIYSSAGIPDWFAKVRICYMWRGWDDPDQCNLSRPYAGGGEYCEFVGSSTKIYLDDTDDRAGGCEMYWQLSVPDTAPGWALNTRMCYYSYGEGNVDQCIGFGNRCAVANKFTTFYEDDTDHRPGGCYMSWGLKTHGEPM